MTNILILHSTVDGQTKKICQTIANQISKTIPDALVLQKSVAGCTLKDLQHSEVIVLGASIRYGKHRNTVYQFVEQYRDQLDTKVTCFFSVNLVARKAEKNTATTNSYVIKFLEQTSWQPNEVDVFAGKLDYALYGFVDKLMIKLIMWITKGPIYSDKPIEFTDWQRVQDFTDKIISHISADKIQPNDIDNQNLNQKHFSSQITAQTTTDKLFIVCPHCDTTNRMPSHALSEKIIESPNCGHCKQPLLSKKPINLNGNIHKHIQTNQILTIVDFWASWCQPCHQIAPQFASASEQLSQVVFAKLQTDQFEKDSVAYNIRSLPTLVAFKNGVEIGRQSGVMSTGQIVQWVQRLG